MTFLSQCFLKKSLFLALFMATFSTLVYAEASQESILNKYAANGFICLDISETINVDTLKSYTDLTALEYSDVVHVCVRTDMTQKRIPGNKYVFVFDEKGSMKTHNRIASILD